MPHLGKNSSFLNWFLTLSRSNLISWSIFLRFAEGFIFNGEKFVLIKADDEVIQGKSKGEAKLPLTIQKCNTCVVVMLGKAGSNGGSVSVAVNKMAQYLKENNY